METFKNKVTKILKELDSIQRGDNYYRTDFKQDVLELAVEALQMSRRDPDQAGVWDEIAQSLYDAINAYPDIRDWSTHYLRQAQQQLDGLKKTDLIDPHPLFDALTKALVALANGGDRDQVLRPLTKVLQLGDPYFDRSYQELDQLYMLLRDVSDVPPPALQLLFYALKKSGTPDPTWLSDLEGYSSLLKATARRRLQMEPEEEIVEPPSAFYQELVYLASLDDVTRVHYEWLERLRAEFENTYPQACQHLAQLCQSFKRTKGGELTVDNEVWEEKLNEAAGASLYLKAAERLRQRAQKARDVQGKGAPEYRYNVGERVYVTAARRYGQIVRAYRKDGVGAERYEVRMVNGKIKDVGRAEIKRNSV